MTVRSYRGCLHEGTLGGTRLFSTANPSDLDRATSPVDRLSYLGDGLCLGSELVVERAFRHGGGVSGGVARICGRGPAGASLHTAESGLASFPKS